MFHFASQGPTSFLYKVYSSMGIHSSTNVNNCCFKRGLLGPTSSKKRFEGRKPLQHRQPQEPRRLQVPMDTAGLSQVAPIWAFSAKAARCFSFYKCFLPSLQVAVTVPTVTQNPLAAQDMAICWAGSEEGNRNYASRATC